MSTPHPTPTPAVTPPPDAVLATRDEHVAPAPDREAGGTEEDPRLRSTVLHQRGLRAPVVLAVAVLLGVVWGAVTSGLQTVLPWPVSGLANAVSPWVAPAFALGAVTRRPWVAAVAGVVVCLAEVGGYYGVSALRDFGVSPAMVLLWLGTGLIGGPVFGVAGWCWRRVGSLRWAGLGAALMGGVFLSEGAVGYGYHLRYTGDAVLFCTLGVVLVLALGALAPVARRARATGRGVCLAGAWLLLVLPLGAAGQFLLRTFA